MKEKTGQDAEEGERKAARPRSRVVYREESGEEFEGIPTTTMHYEGAADEYDACLLRPNASAAISERKSHNLPLTLGLMVPVSRAVPTCIHVSWTTYSRID